MNVLKQIFTVKTLREAKALSAVRRQDGVLAQAIVQRNRAQVSLHEFFQYAQRREIALYDGLLQPRAEPVRLRDIQEVQAEMSVLRTREGEFKAALVNAEEAQNQEAHKLETFKATHAKTYREQQKFVELLQIQAADEALDLERSEEGETDPALGSQDLILGTNDLRGGAGG